MRCPRCTTSTLDERVREGVTIDVCADCRGIWLDRGELEKLMSAAQGQPEYRDAPPSERRYAEPRRHDDDRRWEDDSYRRKKRRGFDIFDIFD